MKVQEFAAVRLRAGLVERADALIEPLSERRELISYARLSRAAVVRVALERGLASLERELGVKAKGGRRG